jgi:hypothetical protein
VSAGGPVCGVDSGTWAGARVARGRVRGVGRVWILPGSRRGGVFGAVYVWGAAAVTVCWLCRRSVGVSEHPKQWMIRRIVLGWVRSFPWESSGRSGSMGRHSHDRVADRPNLAPPRRARGAVRPLRVDSEHRTTLRTCSQDSAASAGGFTQTRGITALRYLTAVRRDRHVAGVGASAAVQANPAVTMELGWKRWLSVFVAATILAGGLASIFHRDTATLLPQQSSDRCSGVCPCGTI